MLHTEHLLNETLAEPRSLTSNAVLRSAREAGLQDLQSRLCAALAKMEGRGVDAGSTVVYDFDSPHSSSLSEVRVDLNRLAPWYDYGTAVISLAVFLFCSWLLTTFP